MKIVRFRLARELMAACGLLDPEACRIEVPLPAREREVLKFHDPGYLGALKQASEGGAGGSEYGIARGDNPPFPGVYEFSLLSSGGSLTAARMVAENRADRVFHIAGGLHHARRDRASGFCYLNDPVVAIMDLLERGMRVVYLDVDAHHGDGVQWAFYETSRVLTISVHQDGRTLFPGTGGVEETGRGGGAGYSVNIPLLPGSSDGLYMRAFTDIVIPLVQWYDPDVVVSQLGVDALRDDPLAALELTPEGFGSLIALMGEYFPRWVALGGGGYNLRTVACVWTRTWEIISGQKCRAEPESLYPGIAALAGVERAAARGPRVLGVSEAELVNRYGEGILKSVREKLSALLRIAL